jgi:hypothetical protein
MSGAWSTAVDPTGLKDFPERLEMFFIMFPASQGSGIDRLTYLVVAQRKHKTVGIVKIKTAAVPFQAAETDQSPACFFLFLNQLCVGYPKNPVLKDGFPMPHQSQILDIEFSDGLQTVAKVVPYGTEV